MTPQQERILQRIDSKLTTLLSHLLGDQKKEKATWVTARIITSMTGWTGDRMQQARKYNWIEFKKASTGGYLYKLESLNDNFKIKKTTDQAPLTKDSE
ncbi:MAG: hypothetical protein ACTHMM_11995 [Agriterribacter sp.]